MRALVKAVFVATVVVLWRRGPLDAVAADAAIVFLVLLFTTAGDPLLGVTFFFFFFVCFFFGETEASSSLSLCSDSSLGSSSLSSL